MGGQASQDGATLHFTLELPHLKLSLQGGAESLPEVRRIIEAVSSDDSWDESLLDLRSRLTDEFLNHPPLARRLKNAALLDEDVRILKLIVPYEQEYDLERGETTKQVSALNVKTRVDALFAELEGTIRECFIHIRGDLNREQQSIVMDAFKQRLGMGVETRFFSTRKNLEGKVLLEVVCFGEDFAEAW